MDEELSPEDIESLSQAMSEAQGDEPSPEEEKESSSQEDLASMVEAASQEADSVQEQEEGQAPSSDEREISHAQFMQLEEGEEEEESILQPIERMYDVKVKVEVVLGQTKMSLEDILSLQRGHVVELNRLAGEPVDVLANNRLIAKAEVVVIDDNFGIKVIEIAGTKQSFGAANA